MKVLQTAIDLVIGLPEILHEYREMKRELHYARMREVRFYELNTKISERNKRIDELEIENRKLLDANHGLKTESDKLRWESEKRGERIKGLGSELNHNSLALSFWSNWVHELCGGNTGESDIGFDAANRIKIETELATSRTALVVSTKPEPSIPEPDPGQGWAFCAKEHASSACVLTAGIWGAWRDSALLTFALPDDHYRFRRPIAKTAQWVACTAEEARANPVDSEWMTSGDKWATMRVSPSNDFNRAFRSRAKLPEFAVVTRSIWDSEALASCERNRQVGLNDGDTWTYHIKRSDVPVGTVLG